MKRPLLPSISPTLSRAIRLLRVLAAIALATTGTPSSLRAQVGHEGHALPAPSDAIDRSRESMPQHSAGMDGMPDRPFGIPMTRMGSGTSWLPDASAMRAWHFMAGSWMLMVHGDAFLQYDHQDGPLAMDTSGSRSCLTPTKTSTGSAQPSCIPFVWAAGASGPRRWSMARTGT